MIELEAGGFLMLEDDGYFLLENENENLVGGLRCVVYTSVGGVVVQSGSRVTVRQVGGGILVTTAS